MTGRLEAHLPTKLLQILPNPQSNWRPQIKVSSVFTIDLHSSPSSPALLWLFLPLRIGTSPISLHQPSTSSAWVFMKNSSHTLLTFSPLQAYLHPLTLLRYSIFPSSQRAIHPIENQSCLFFWLTIYLTGRSNHFLSCSFFPQELRITRFWISKVSNPNNVY